MQRSNLGIVILTQNSKMTESAVQTAAPRLFSHPESSQVVYLLHHKKTDRVQKLNEWLDRNLDCANRILAVDADQLQLESLSNLTEYIETHTFDISLCCDPSPRIHALNAHRNRYARYLCEQSVFFFFSEKAIRRMRNADTTELIQEALADDSLSVCLIPNGLFSIGGRQALLRRVRMIGCVFNLRTLLLICAAAALLACVIFLICYIRTQAVMNLIGCIVCLHLFLSVPAILLIRWYKRSAKTEQKKREHLYVEESLSK